MLTVEEALVRWAADQIGVHYSKIESVDFGINEPDCDTCGYCRDVAQINWSNNSRHGGYREVEVDDITGLIRNITARIQSSGSQ